MRESLRARLLLWYSVVIVLIVTVFGASVCYVFWRSLVARVDAELLERAATIARALRPAGSGAFDLDLSHDAREYFQLDRIDQPYYGIWSDTGRLIDVSDPDLTIVAPPQIGAVTRAGRREVAIRGPAETMLLVGRDLSVERNAVRSLALSVGTVGTGALALSLLCGWFLAGRALAPIGRINRTAQAMANGNLAARIPADKTESELGQVALALNTAFDRLDAALEQQRRFTADASHELRTPLATIQAESEWALSRERTTQQYRESLTTCRRAAKRMGGLVEGLLTLARADAQELPLQKIAVNFEDLVLDVVDMARPVAERSGVRIVTSVEPVEVDGDPERLQQAVSNLVDNAVRHGRAGGTIDVRVTLENETLTLTVTDDGGGIAPEHLPHIFERFYRADSARATEGGAGLGLALTKWIVERHDGHISCTSEPGKGATFTIRLSGARRLVPSKISNRQVDAR